MYFIPGTQEVGYDVCSKTSEKLCVIHKYKKQIGESINNKKTADDVKKGEKIG